MSLIADILLVAASLGLAVYCVVLSRRLARFTDLEKGVGGAVAVLSAQVDDLTKALKTARETAQRSVSALNNTTTRAEDVAKRLELHVAALHDLPAQPAAPAPAPAPQPAAPVATAAAQPAAPYAPAPEMQAPPALQPAPPPDPEAVLDAAFEAADESGDAPQTLSFSARRPSPEPVEAELAPSLFAHRKVQPGALG